MFLPKYEAMVRMRIQQPNDSDDTPTDYLTRVVGDPELGVLVLNVKAPKGRAGKYEATVHVRVNQPKEFEKIEPMDYLRIHLTDEEFGLLVEDVKVVVILGPN